ncbi:MAG: DNA primase [Candidatus Tokpelaia sp. JSC188]|nr:MAG: DNA primase [Candidatus Tokpelaia sp. JSC188]
MRFSADFLDKIRSRVPISAVVRTRVNFNREKTNTSRGDFWACCPFHLEKTPSFHCNDRRGRYHCFGCGVSGDHFRFISELDGLSFFEAVERLADMAGISMPQPDSETKKREAKQASLYKIMELAAGFFEQLLQKDEGACARSYLRERSLSSGVQRMFRLGYAADSRNLLKKFLIAKGVCNSQLETSGLLVLGDDVASYDRFRNRIMFPIENASGRIIGFGGRALFPDTRAKYLNSPETKLFCKRRTLYNFSRAKQANLALCRGEVESKPIIVVEGYMDVIALVSAGFEKAVSPLGTTLTEDQLHLLWRFSSQTILCFDGDEAGYNAALRVLDRALPLLKVGLSLSFVLLSNGKDPDDIIREGGKEIFNELLKQAVPMADMLWRREIQGQAFKTPESRAALEKRLRDAAFTIKDESLRHYYLQDIRERLQMFFKPWTFAPFHKESKTKRCNAQNTTLGRLCFSESLIHSDLVKNRKDPILVREAAILVTLANHPQLWNENFETLASLEFSNQELTKLHCAMLDIMAEENLDNADSMFQLLDKKGKSAIMACIVQLVRNIGMRSAFAVAPIEEARAALKQALHLYKRAHCLHKQLREIETELLENLDSSVFALLSDVKNELERTNATDALIEGFGLWDVDTNHQNDSLFFRESATRA